MNAATLAKLLVPVVPTLGLVAGAKTDVAAAVPADQPTSAPGEVGQQRRASKVEVDLDAIEPVAMYDQAAQVVVHLARDSVRAENSTLSFDEEDGEHRHGASDSAGD